MLMLNNILFNGIRMPDFLILKDIQIQLLGDVKNNFVESSHGSRHKNIKFGTKRVKLELSTIFETGDIIPKSDIDDITKWIRGNDWKPSKLVLPGYEDEYYMAIVDNSGDVKNDIIEGVFTLEFICLNPNRTSEVEYKASFTSTSTIDYLGTTNTYPNIKINVTSKCSELKLSISNSKHNNYIKFKGDFNSGEIIEIDMRTKKVLRNNEVNMPILTLDSRFHELIPGDNKYALTSGNASIEIKYRNEYI